MSPFFAEGKSKLASILAILVVAPYCFVGFDTIPQSAEEFNFSHRKTIGIMALAIIWGAIVYIAVNMVTAAVVPQGYDSWVDYIGNTNNLTGIEAMPTFNAAYTLLGKWGLVFLAFAVFSACLTGINGFYMAGSRLLYSMSNEKVILEIFGKLNDRGTPSNAIIFIFLISLFGPLFGRTVLGWIVDMSSVGAAIGYAYTSAAAFKNAKHNHDRKVMITGIIGTIMGVLFMVLLLIPISAFNCSLGKEAYICLAVWTIMGIIFYIKTRKENN